MEATATFRYDAVRYLPSHSEILPIQILGSSFRTDMPQTGMIELSLEQAEDLYDSLGTLLRGVEQSG